MVSTCFYMDPTLIEQLYPIHRLRPLSTAGLAPCQGQCETTTSETPSPPLAQDQPLGEVDKKFSPNFIITRARPDDA